MLRQRVIFLRVDDALCLLLISLSSQKEIKRTIVAKVSTHQREEESYKRFGILISSILGPKMMMMIERTNRILYILPLKRYLYTSFLFALEINIIQFIYYVFVQQDFSSSLLK